MHGADDTMKSTHLASSSKPGKKQQNEWPFPVFVLSAANTGNILCLPASWNHNYYMEKIIMHAHMNIHYARASKRMIWEVAWACIGLEGEDGQGEADVREEKGGKGMQRCYQAGVNHLLARVTNYLVLAAQSRWRGGGASESSLLPSTRCSQYSCVCSGIPPTPAP